MKQIALLVISVLLLLCSVEAILAQEPIIFPAKGQSQEQTEKDKFSCYQWAKNETGFAKRR